MSHLPDTVANIPVFLGREPILAGPRQIQQTLDITKCVTLVELVTKTNNNIELFHLAKIYKLCIY